MKSYMHAYVEEGLDEEVEGVPFEEPEEDSKDVCD